MSGLSCVRWLCPTYLTFPPEGWSGRGLDRTSQAVFARDRDSHCRVNVTGGFGQTGANRLWNKDSEGEVTGVLGDPWCQLFEM